MSKSKGSGKRVDAPGPRTAAAPSPPEPGRRVWRVAVPVLLAVTVIAVLATKPPRGSAPSGLAPAAVSSHSAVAPAAGLPRLVDLGADTCIPCKAMAPILVELRAEYAGKLRVDFIDVWKDPHAGDPYDIYAIPTQIFFDGDGRELTRHEGFISKQDILATWKRLGFEFSQPGASMPRS